MSDKQTSGGITIHVGPTKLQMLQLAGAAMSDTPRTDALKAFQEKEYYFSDYAVRLHYFEEFARELERENTALRADKERLLALLEDCVYFADNSEGIVGWHLNGEVFPWKEIEVIQQARSAIDAARKEAQP